MRGDVGQQPAAAASAAPAPAGRARDELVLVLAPTGRDMPLACALLTERAGVQCESCSDIIDLCNKIRGQWPADAGAGGSGGGGAEPSPDALNTAGNGNNASAGKAPATTAPAPAATAAACGAAIIAEEALDFGGARMLIDLLSQQLPWSDLPVLILARADDITGAGVVTALRQRANVTVLDRPVRIVSLITAVQSALRARRRQYEVRDLLAETREAVRQRDQFLAMLGHERRNPLGAISNAMSVIDTAQPTTDALELEQRDIIRRQTEHLARLVDDLLDVSRITSGKIALQPRPIDLCELVHRAAKVVDGPARAHRHEVKVTTSCEPMFVDADPVRMEQVINNLLTNAIKYTPPGGRIEARVDATGGGGGGGEAILRVRDNGIGMSPELLPRVFDLFTQAERALDRSQGGLGIGLTLVRALVEMHGGRVSVHSDGPGKGSEFTITLPRVAAPKPEVPAGTGANGRQRNILIVEDQPDARRALQRLLQIWGHRVDTAADGIRAVELAGQRPPEMALIDVGLPGMDGYEVARRLRASLGEKVRLIALTGYGQPEDRERAYDAGFDLHLVKPVDRDQLSRALSDQPIAELRRQTQPA